MSLTNTTWHHIRRSPFQSLTAIFIILLTFTIGTFFTYVTDGFNNVLNYFETKPEITVFLKDGLDKSTVENIQTELSSYNGVKEIKYISKDKALSIYRDQNKDNPLLLEMVTASVLPASFEVSVSDPQVLSQIADNFKQKNNVVDEIIYQKDIIQSLLNWTRVIRQVGIVIIGSLSFIAFILIFALIGMKITNRKEEIRISRLLGASSFYVKKPFLAEGLIYGLAGCVFGYLIATSLTLYYKSTINQFFQPVIFLPNLPEYYIRIFIVEVVVGSVLGLMASWFGVKRYIKF